MTSTNSLSPAQLKQKTIDYLNEISNQNKFQQKTNELTKFNGLNDSMINIGSSKRSNSQDINNGFNSITNKTYKRRYLLPQTPRVKLRLSSSSDNSFFHRRNAFNSQISGGITSQKFKLRNILFKNQPYKSLFTRLSTVFEEDELVRTVKTKSFSKISSISKSSSNSNQDLKSNTSNYNLNSNKKEDNQITKNLEAIFSNKKTVDNNIKTKKVTNISSKSASLIINTSSGSLKENFKNLETNKEITMNNDNILLSNKKDEKNNANKTDPNDNNYYYGNLYKTKRFKATGLPIDINNQEKKSDYSSYLYSDSTSQLNQIKKAEQSSISNTIANKSNKNDEINSQNSKFLITQSTSNLNKIISTKDPIINDSINTNILINNLAKNNKNVSISTNNMTEINKIELSKKENKNLIRSSLINEHRLTNSISDQSFQSKNSESQIIIKNLESTIQNKMINPTQIREKVYIRETVPKKENNNMKDSSKTNIDLNENGSINGKKMMGRSVSVASLERLKTVLITEINKTTVNTNQNIEPNKTVNINRSASGSSNLTSDINNNNNSKTSLQTQYHRHHINHNQQFNMNSNQLQNHSLSNMTLNDLNKENLLRLENKYQLNFNSHHDQKNHNQQNNSNSNNQPQRLHHPPPPIPHNHHYHNHHQSLSTFDTNIAKANHNNGNNINHKRKIQHSLSEKHTSSTGAFNQISTSNQNQSINVHNHNHQHYHQSHLIPANLLNHIGVNNEIFSNKNNKQIEQYHLQHYHQNHHHPNLKNKFTPSLPTANHIQNQSLNQKSSSKLISINQLKSTFSEPNNFKENFGDGLSQGVKQSNIINLESNNKNNSTICNPSEFSGTNLRTRTDSPKLRIISKDSLPPKPNKIHKSSSANLGANDMLNSTTTQQAESNKIKSEPIKQAEFKEMSTNNINNNKSTFKLDLNNKNQTKLANGATAITTKPPNQSKNTDTIKTFSRSFENPSVLVNKHDVNESNNNNRNSLNFKTYYDQKTNQITIKPMSPKSSTNINSLENSINSKKSNISNNIEKIYNTDNEKVMIYLEKMSKILNDPILNNISQKTSATVRNLPLILTKNKPVFHTITATKLVPPPKAHQLPVLKNQLNSNNFNNLNNFHTNSTIFNDNQLNASTFSSSSISSNHSININNNNSKNEYVEKSGSFYSNLLEQSNNSSLNLEDYLFKPSEITQSIFLGMAQPSNTIHNSSMANMSSTNSNNIHHNRNSSSDSINRSNFTNNKTSQPHSSTKPTILNKNISNSNINLLSDQLIGLKLSQNDLIMKNINNSPSLTNSYSNKLYSIENNLNIKKDSSINNKGLINSNISASSNPQTLNNHQIKLALPTKFNDQQIGLNDNKMTSLYSNYDSKTNMYRYDKSQKKIQSNNLDSMNSDLVIKNNSSKKNLNSNDLNNSVFDSKVKNIVMGGLSLAEHKNKNEEKINNVNNDLDDKPLKGNNFYQESLRQMNQEEKELLRNHYAKFENESYIRNSNIDILKKLESVSIVDKVEAEVNKEKITAGSSSDFDYEEHDSFEIFY